MINPHEEMLSEKFFLKFSVVFSAQFAVINSGVILVILRLIPILIHELNKWLHMGLSRAKVWLCLVDML